jgi:hypothetical protein
MFDRVLLAFDGSQASKHALADVTPIAKLTRVSSSYWPSFRSPMRTLISGQRVALARHYLQHHAARQSAG